MLNLCQFIGNLGQDPELRSTQGGQSVCSLSVAVNEKRKQGTEWVEHTEWVKVTVWGPQAEACGKYLAKGRQVYVSGRMTTRKWQDKEGKDRWTTEINANEVKFLGGGKKDEGGSERHDRSAPDGNDASASSDGFDRDIPF